MRMFVIPLAPSAARPNGSMLNPTGPVKPAPPYPAGPAVAEQRAAVATRTADASSHREAARTTGADESCVTPGITVDFAELLQRAAALAAVTEQPAA